VGWSSGNRRCRGARRQVGRPSSRSSFDGARTIGLGGERVLLASWAIASSVDYGAGMSFAAGLSVQCGTSDQVQTAREVGRGLGGGSVRFARSFWAVCYPVCRTKINERTMHADAEMPAGRPRFPSPRPSRASIGRQQKYGGTVRVHH
jgi:hypothetical protein